MNENIYDRAALRIKVFEPADMTIGDRHHRVHIINVSVSGALLHGDLPPRVGQRLTLRCGALLADARIAWVAGNRFGVAFTRPIKEAALGPIIGEQQPINMRVASAGMA